MRGSNPARGAHTYGRGHGVHPVSNAEGEGSIPSVRASLASPAAPGSRPAEPASARRSRRRASAAFRVCAMHYPLRPRALNDTPGTREHMPRSSSRPGCRPLKPVTRVRIPLGALHAIVVSAVARGVANAAGRVRLPAVASGFPGRGPLPAGGAGLRGPLAALRPLRSGARAPGTVPLPTRPQRDARKPGRSDRNIEGLWCQRQTHVACTHAIGVQLPGAPPHALGRAWGAARLSPG